MACPRTSDRQPPAPQTRAAHRSTWALAACAMLAACSTPAPQSTAPVASGAAGGSTSVGGDASLQTCPQTVGTVRLQDGNATAQTAGSGTGESSALESLRGLLRDVDSIQQRNNKANAGVSIESLRLLIQQSNCLAIVERGLGEEAASDEKGRARSPNGEVREDANMGKGQEVAADFVLRSLVLAVSANESSSGVSLSGFNPLKMLGGLTTSKSSSSADVQLVLFDVRSKVQLAVAQGHGSGDNTGMATNVLGRAGGMFGGVKVDTKSNTSTAKVLLQAYADAYNKLVPAISNYKSQSVKGGLGAGGNLGVQGARNDASALPK